MKNWTRYTDEENGSVACSVNKTNFVCACYQKNNFYYLAVNTFEKLSLLAAILKCNVMLTNSKLSHSAS